MKFFDVSFNFVPKCLPVRILVKSDCIISKGYDSPFRITFTFCSLPSYLLVRLYFHYPAFHISIWSSLERAHTRLMIYCEFFLFNLLLSIFEYCLYCLYFPIDLLLLLLTILKLYLLVCHHGLNFKNCFKGFLFEFFSPSFSQIASDL